MRIASALAMLTACAPGVDAPVDFGAAKTVVFVIPAVGESHRAVVVDASASPFSLPFEPNTELYLFDQPRSLLRLPEAPLVLPAPSCPLNERVISSEAPLCLTGEAFVPCTPPPRRLSLVPYLGEPCFRARINDAHQSNDFNLQPARDTANPATVLVDIGGGVALLGQLVITATAVSTAIQKLDLSTDAVAPVDLMRLDGPWGPGVVRDARSVWIAGPRGAVGSLDVTTGALERIIEPSPWTLVSLERAPDDGEALLAVTSSCSLVRREGARWNPLTGSIDPRNYDGLDARLRCYGQVTWTASDEAIAVGVVVGPMPVRVGTLEKALQSVVRLRGDEITTEPVPWPEALPHGYLSAIAWYRAPDGTRVEVTTGVARAEPTAHDLDLAKGREQWFVRDPRRADVWIRVDDPDQGGSFWLARLVPWAGGVFGTGGFEQAFLEEHWSGPVPLAALTAHAASRPALADRRIFTAAVDDGRGGYLIASAFPDAITLDKVALVSRAPRTRFIWWQRR